VNPQFHEEFVALSALFYSGEISEEEWALLQIHMGYCDSCHDRFLEYERIASDAIPAMAAAAVADLDNAPRESANSLKAAELRLISQLSSSSIQQELPRRKSSSRLPTALIAACVIGIACLAGIHFIRIQRKPVSGVATVSDRKLPAQSAPSETESVTRQALERSQSEVSTLQQQLSSTQDRFKQSSLATTTIEQQLATEQVQRKQINEQMEAVNQQLVAAQTQARSQQEKLTSADAEVTQQMARAAALDAKVHELNAALDERDITLSDKDRMLALDKDFLAHDRDIRDLIGARNLYIADIFDMNQSGKTAKPFGRIFYTQDRSLVFYGFDLEKQVGLKQDAAFQVWGSGSDKPAVSLGLFYQDDTHKRWVLRCNDSKTLARLNMVFVTVEPPGGSGRPTGKQLLRAYLQIQPNHP
jgi:hypothetical protein